jgi:hypothetical protein
MHPLFIKSLVNAYSSNDPTEHSMFALHKSAKT